MKNTYEHPKHVDVVVTLYSNTLDAITGGAARFDFSRAGRSAPDRSRCSPTVNAINVPPISRPDARRSERSRGYVHECRVIPEMHAGLDAVRRVNGNFGLVRAFRSGRAASHIRRRPEIRPGNLPPNDARFTPTAVAGRGVRVRPRARNGEGVRT